MDTTLNTPHPRRRGDLPDLTGQDAVEIKVTIRPDQELRAERAMLVDEDTAEVRVIYFYDTPELDLFEAGVALRARLIKGDDDDSTVKFRSTQQSVIAPEWYRHEGFKVEADMVGDRIVYSVSLTCRQRRDEIDEVATGKRAIDKLYSDDQERFLSAFYSAAIDFKRLCVMGPIRVLKWKLKHKGFPYGLAVEEWRLPNGEDLVEVSIKAPPAEARQAQQAFDEHLRSLNLDPQGAQETKTRTALEYFAQTCGDDRDG